MTVLLRTPEPQGRISLGKSRERLRPTAHRNSNLMPPDQTRLARTSCLPPTQQRSAWKVRQGDLQGASAFQNPRGNKPERLLDLLPAEWCCGDRPRVVRDRGGPHLSASDGMAPCGGRACVLAPAWGAPGRRWRGGGGGDHPCARAPPPLTRAAVRA